MRILSSSGAGVAISAKGYFLDRRRFDNYYLGQAERAGVMLLRGTARNAIPDSGRRIVKIDDNEIDARIVVDASGVNSDLARQAGLSPMLHPTDIAWAVEAEILHPEIGEEKFFQYWIGSMAPGWKATFSPAGGDYATLGVFVRGHGQNVHSFFRAFLKMFKAQKFAEYRKIEDLRILSIKRPMPFAW